MHTYKQKCTCVYIHTINSRAYMYRYMLILKDEFRIITYIRTCPWEYVCIYVHVFYLNTYIYTCV